ncbi:MAG: outer membrane protein assembly factor BamE [Alphaproteobacteria bacterium]|nr:outer membrane protein assembly factor BamE [Alphaproteobacteria bacterium]MCL2504915.1 outer membrane protein assembly factor BamE [Alphaproteobacteria bacterium]
MTTNFYTSYISSLLLAALLGMTACVPTVSTSGTFVHQDDLEQIKQGQSTREDVVMILGSPVFTSTVDDKVWYYVGRQAEQVSFFMPTLVKQEAIEIVFDDAGVVADVRNIDAAARDVALVDKETPTHGHSKTVLTEILGVMAKPTPKIPNVR